MKKYLPNLQRTAKAALLSIGTFATAAGCVTPVDEPTTHEDSAAPTDLQEPEDGLKSADDLNVNETDLTSGRENGLVFPTKRYDLRCEGENDIPCFQTPANGALLKFHCREADFWGNPIVSESMGYLELRQITSPPNTTPETYGPIIADSFTFVDHGPNPDDIIFTGTVRTPGSISNGFSLVNAPIAQNGIACATEAVYYGRMRINVPYTPANPSASLEMYDSF